MSGLRVVATVGATAMLLAGSCVRNTPQTSAGVLDVNAFTASRSVLVHVQNTSPTRVRVFTIIGNKVGLITNLATNGQQTVVLDPSLFPGTSFSLEVRPENGPPRRLGPFSPSKGQTVDLFVAPNLDAWRVTIIPTKP